MRVRPRIASLLLVLALALAIVPAASASSNAPLVPDQVTPASLNVPPPGFTVSAKDAIRIAGATGAVRKERAKHPGMQPDVTIPGYVGHDDRWQVTYTEGAKQLAEIHVSRRGQVLETWTGPQVEFPLARGYSPSVGGALNKAYVWIPLALLFLAPFFDPRRPFRMLHFDLLALLGFGLSQLFFNKGQIDVSVPLAYPFLGYLLVRLLVAGFRPRRERGPLIPLAPTALLVIGLVALVGFRVTLNVVDSNVIDVGYASVVGADRVTHGEELYTDNDIHGDAYGPVNYIAYAPFEALFPTAGTWDSVPAAHAAALTFDLLTLLGLFLLGTRMRAGPPGRRLGIAFAYAWAAFPFTLYVLQENTNDGLVAMLLVTALLAVRSAPGRGALLGLGAAAKFVPLALAPLFATGTGDRRPASIVRYAAVLVAVLALATVIYLPKGGLHELWNCTLGYQLGRSSPFSLWGLHPSLEGLQTVVKALAVALALAVGFIPGKRDLRQVAALGAAVVIALQLAATHWFYFYIVWFAPFALVALLGGYRTDTAPPEAAASAAAERRELVPA